MLISNFYPKCKQVNIRVKLRINCRWFGQSFWLSVTKPWVTLMGSHPIPSNCLTNIPFTWHQIKIGYLDNEVKRRVCERRLILGTVRQFPAQILRGKLKKQLLSCSEKSVKGRKIGKGKLESFRTQSLFKYGHPVD